MNRFVRSAIITAALVALPTLAATPAFAATAGSAGSAAAKVPSAAVMAQYEAEVVKLTNDQRVARGCKALRTDSRLTQAARAHSADMVAEKFFSHTGSNGSNFVVREVAAGYPKRDAAAENISWGYRTPRDAVNAWMNSSGHRANILNCASTAVGVGVVYNKNGAPYWTQDFGRS